MTNSIKFFWNGLRLNGEKSLVKCWYSMNNHKDHEESVTIYADGYGSNLPRDLFQVINETDSYTDYFDNDHAVLTPEHPLYKYAKHAAVKAEIRNLKLYVNRMTKNIETDPYYTRNNFYVDELRERKSRLAALEAIKDPGHPTAEDLEKVNQMRQEAENARIAAQHEAELKAREEVLRQKNEGSRYINEVAAEHPIKEGEPVVTINWSENPAFYGWKDNELKLSVAAAEIILKHFDEKVHAEEDRGYDKTSFTINWVNEEGEQDTYEGRYDLGDNDGGMIKHIRDFGRDYKEKGCFYNGHPTDDDIKIGEAIMAVADMLDKYKADEKVIVLADWARKVLAGRDAEKLKSMKWKELSDLLTRIDPNDEEKREMAEEIVKELCSRDMDHGLAVHRTWNGREERV